jgi:methyl-accepting chemotaxis protein/methyl-accepting chemotaxis protein-1 (serine sensor receptor)
MGFAVVADEVRSLAQRSAQAAKDTASLIEDSVVKAEAGKRRLGEVVGSIHRVSGEFNGLATLVDEVSHGSKEQSVGISQIGRALSQMERVTQSSAATAEETAAAAEELNAQSQSLQDLTRRLNQMVGSAAASGLSSGSSSIKRYPASVSGARQSMPRRLTGNPSFARARGGVENAQDGASFEAAFGSF